MRRVTAILLCIAMLVTFFGINSVALEADSFIQQGLIECKTASYKDGKKYSGSKITNPQLDVKKFATLDILDCGGTHIDGDGNPVFSNYVAFSVFLNFNKSTKYIADTSVKVSKDSCDWNDMNAANNYKYGEKENATEKQISYGTVVATRTDGNGNVFKYTPVFSTGNTSFEQQFFNVDGDYTIYVFFETVKGGTYQNHVISWSFKVRSSIYLRDKTSELHIKNSGLSGNDVIVDTADRQNVSVQIYKDGKFYKDHDGKPLTESGKYRFVVKSNGFTSEVFYFIIDKENIDQKIFFRNLKRQIGKSSYEAEGYFTFEWNDDITNPIQPDSVCYYFCNGEGKDLMNSGEEKFQGPYAYTKNEVLDTVGLYRIHAFDGKQSVTYYVYVTEMDNPSANYEKLYTKRFNNFKTKWWQVYDEGEGRYLCFDYDTEYDRAYNAAMTIANNTVIESTGRYFFKNTWYNDRIALTAAMNEYVFNYNLATFYYDPADYSDDAESERTFSSMAFDNAVYLNDEFQFVSSHPSEVAEVVATDKNGVEYTIEFSKPISEQTTPLGDGEYTITETDKYGNKNTYTVYRDKTAPVVTLNAASGDFEAADGGEYEVSYFSVASFVDTYDSYSVLKVVSPTGTSYYYKDEYRGLVFSGIGEYLVSAYDRNGNTVEFKITVK